MKKYTTKITVLTLSLILFLTAVMPVYVFADEGDSTIMPRWSVIGFMNLDIVFPAEGEGIVSGVVMGQSNATLLEGRIRLFEYVDNAWVLIGDYSNTVSNSSLVVEGYFDTVRGRDYKAYFYVTAHSADDRERTYCKVEETCP